jgi:hypothetical protein
MRRYMLAALAGIAQVDDDGNAASASPPHPKAAKPAAAPAKADEWTKTTSAVIVLIRDARTLEELDGLKAQVAELGVQEVANEYIAKKKELKGSKK